MKMKGEPQHDKLATGFSRKGARRGKLNKSLDKLGTNGKLLIPFVVSLSNHERNQAVQPFPGERVLRAMHIRTLLC
ncbi:MAG: hypothetical protein WAK92_08060, partial [Thiobacillus sp.]